MRFRPRHPPAHRRERHQPLHVVLMPAGADQQSVPPDTVTDCAIEAGCVLSFTQEYGASRATEALKQRISRKAVVLRDGVECSVAAEDIVPGDVIRLSAGNLIPADGVILDARDFNVSEAVLTGETFPVV